MLKNVLEVLYIIKNVNKIIYNIIVNIIKNIIFVKLVFLSGFRREWTNVFINN